MIMTSLVIVVWTLAPVVAHSWLPRFFIQSRHRSIRRAPSSSDRNTVHTWRTGRGGVWCRGGEVNADEVRNEGEVDDINGIDDNKYVIVIDPMDSNGRYFCKVTKASKYTIVMFSLILTSFGSALGHNEFRVDCCSNVEPRGLVKASR